MNHMQWMGAVRMRVQIADKNITITHKLHVCNKQDIFQFKRLLPATCGLLWFYQLFELSFWWHPFTAEDPLVSKWCNAKFPQIFSDEITLRFNNLKCPEYIFSQILAEVDLFDMPCSYLYCSLDVLFFMWFTWRLHLVCPSLWRRTGPVAFEKPVWPTC